MVGVAAAAVIVTIQVDTHLKYRVERKRKNDEQGA